MRVSTRQACRVVQLARRSYYYKSAADPLTTLRVRLRDLAKSRISYGYRRLHVLLRREGWTINHKRVYRLYCEEGLGLRIKRPRRRRSGEQTKGGPPRSKMGCSA
jgi:putative transposase